MSALKISFNIAEDMVVFKYIFHCCKQSLSASEQNICSCMINVTVLPLQPPTHSVQQCPHYPCNGTIASCHSKGHTWKYGVRSGLQGGCGLVIFFMVTYSYKGMHSNLVFQCSCQDFTVVHIGKKSVYNTCLIPKDSNNDFSCWWHILQNSSSLGVSCASSPSISAWIWVYNGGHRLHSIWHFVTGSPHSWFLVMQKISGSCLPCVFVCNHQCTDLVIAKLFSNCHYTAFTDGWGGG